VWGPEYSNRRDYLKLYIWYLRQKIEEDPRRPLRIVSERGQGYRLLIEPQESEGNRCWRRVAWQRRRGASICGRRSIGALLAWGIAGFLYTRRAAIKTFALKLWTPLVALRARLQSSQEERYVDDLQEALRGLLLFDPVEPQLVFCPPTFQTAAPVVAASVEGDNFLALLEIRFDALLEGHPRLLIIGPQAAGRTTTLVMVMRQVLAQAKGRKPYTRFPVWLDLNYFKELPNPQASALDKLAALANLYFPSLAPQWALTHLRRDPALILVDNWEALPPNARDQAARWIGELSRELPDSICLVSSGTEGYGLFVEAGFVRSHWFRQRARRWSSRSTAAGRRCFSGRGRCPQNCASSCSGPIRPELRCWNSICALCCIS
jgi:hypothetical protein